MVQEALVIKQTCREYESLIFFCRTHQSSHSLDIGGNGLSTLPMRHRSSVHSMDSSRLQLSSSPSLGSSDVFANSWASRQYSSSPSTRLADFTTEPSSLETRQVEMRHTMPGMMGDTGSNFHHGVSNLVDGAANFNQSVNMNYAVNQSAQTVKASQRPMSFAGTFPAMTPMNSSQVSFNCDIFVMKCLPLLRS